jgi:hypothetical protein
MVSRSIIGLYISTDLKLVNNVLGLGVMSYRSTVLNSSNWNKTAFKS